MITRLLSANSSPKVTHFRGVLSANVLSRLSIKTVGRDNIMFSGWKSLFQSHFIHFRGVQPRYNEGTTATKSQLRASVLPQSHPDRHVLALLFPTKQSAEMFHVAENGSRTNSSSFVHRPRLVGRLAPAVYVHPGILERNATNSTRFAVKL
ncbi:hypothetical protein TGRH88_081530 [Toxoplasma gondii]|uniref:Uncharacterized protein n=1 Tax=Toxoplasma gondii TaxID=5811 RepID=A0A7J6K5D3_TOXGO|nr:hypothetical protein TGRH88_081530 [Toxoplasma gondii]